MAVILSIGPDERVIFRLQMPDYLSLQKSNVFFSSSSFNLSGSQDVFPSSSRTGNAFDIIRL